MAKETKKAPASSSSVDNIFSQLIGQHNKISNGMATSGSGMESEVKYNIDSGSLLLNMTLSNKTDGGWPSGRIVEVFGKESIGKSTLGYVAMANCQRMGGIAIYADAEMAGNKKFMQMLGIDLDELIITNENVIEKLFQGIEDNLKYLIANNIRRDKPVMIVVDSVTSLETEAGDEGGYGYNMNIQMKKAMMLGKALRKIIPYLNKANACLYLVNQIRDNTTGYGECVDPYTTKIKVKVPKEIFEIHQKQIEYVDLELSFDEFIRAFINQDVDYNVEQITPIDITDLGILINSKSVILGEDSYEPLTHILFKPKVDGHYRIIDSDGNVLKTTNRHMTHFDGHWIESQTRVEKDKNTIFVNEPIDVVDCTVANTECYYANGQLNHNSYVVPGGKSIPFYASIRLYLQGKSKIIARDPTVENEFQEAMNAWKKTKIGEKPVRGKADEVTIGYEITSYTKKNKLAPPDRTAHFRIIFNKGLFDIECYLDYAIKYGIVKQSGAWCEFVSPEILEIAGKDGIPKFYSSAWLDILQGNPGVYDKLEELLVKKLTIPFDIDTSSFSIDTEEVSDKDEYDVPLERLNSEDIIV